LWDLPVDPDVDASTDSGRAPNAQPDLTRPPRSRWPRIRWSTVVAVTVGGFVGGLARYGLQQAWPTPKGRYPWVIFTVNTAGAFILGLLLVVVMEVLPPTRHLRALVGTGFCGALTTFSSVAVDVDQLAAHGHATTAVAYLAGSLVAGLAAAGLGVVAGRSLGLYRERGRQQS
jgi:CrcB protein